MAERRYPISAWVRTAGVALVCVACRPVEPAPRDQDALVHRFWAGFAVDDDASMQEALRALEEVTDEVAVQDEHTEGESTRLSAEEQALVPLEGEPRPDPAAARGLTVTYGYTCDMADLADVLVFADQNAVYDVYDDYARHFDEDTAPFIAGTDPSTGWNGDIAATIPLFGSYDYEFRTELRRVPLPDDFPEAGDAILARTFMVSPAAWSKENGGFPQDYQIEIYYPSAGAVVHFTGIWREMNVSPELTMEGDIVIRTTVSQMIKWDDTTEKVCAEGLPAPG